jgi:hypothetical protein
MAPGRQVANSAARRFDSARSICRMVARPRILILLTLPLIIGGCGRESESKRFPGGGSAAPAEKISYNFHVRPILSDHCFACHGPDPSHRKAGLRLDKPEEAYAALKESPGHGIVPGQPGASAVITRVLSDDPALVMPPPDSHLTLSTEQKEILSRWVEQGAEYEPHWAFLALPATVPVPGLGNPALAENDVDRFVFAELEKRGIQPSPPASPEKWLRRVSLDLTGLPPSPERVKSFLDEHGKDPEKAREAAVDALLASPAYGEHMAVAWLDAARYADSFGYQSDNLNTQWPWRDWVIRAFNSNMPYDEFVTWQLAGDLLPGATRDQVLATAFSRNHRMTGEGGSIPEEWKIENAADRLHTFGTTMLGLTMECSRCHDHKYDPIPARDYYSLLAFFNSIDENGLYDHPSKVPSPSLLLPTAEQEKDLAVAAGESSVAAVAARLATDAAGFAAWNQANRPLEGWPGLRARFSCDETDGEPANAIASSEIKARRNGLPAVPGQKGNAVGLDGDRGLELTGLPALDRWQAFSFAFQLRLATVDPGRQVVLQKTHGTDVGYNGFDLVIENGHLVARLYRVWPGNGFGVRSRAALPAGVWKHIVVSHDASDKAAGLRLHLDGEPMETEIVRDRIHKSAAVKTHGSGNTTFGQRFRDRGLKDAAVDEIAFFDRAITDVEARWLGDGLAVPGPEQLAALDEVSARAFHLAAVSGPASEARAKASAALKKMVGVEDRIHEVSVMEELPQPEPMWILARGAYDAPRTDANRVTRDVFGEILPRFPEGQPRDRLGLARWLTDPNHPLTARVMVNRVWANFFGTGLVSTPENFGLQGALPTHPQLLDWLARDFVSSGWDIKHLCRVIVLSSTYAQDSATRADLLDIDPENKWLARGPSHRLGAEQIRDAALAISGLLDQRLGGPPVSPYQPGGDLWRESNPMSPAYKESVGKDLHRRSVYSIWKRTSPLPNMTAFDAGSREVCSVYRPRTNTPLQALVLLNDIQFVEAASALSSRMISAASDDAARLRAGFLAATGREAEAAEEATLLALLAEQREIFRSSSGDADAVKFLAASKASPPANTETAEAAAWVVVAQVLLNLDATLWKR